MEEKDASTHSRTDRRCRLTRRELLAAASSGIIWTASRVRAAGQTPVGERLAAIRSRVGGRLGVYALDTQTGRSVGFDEDSRFAMASTFKVLLAAAVLAKVDRGESGLTQVVTFGPGDMLSHAPVTSAHLARGSLTLGELCAAVVEVSDNPAANLLLRQIGGPPGFTRFVRGLGDTETRLDRFELDLNSNLPGDPRDTTTPRAMVGSLEQVLTGDVLLPSSRTLLQGWMVTSSTGLQRIRAGLPGEWRAGDKTGTGANGAVNDLAIAWPPLRKPVLIAIYMSGSSETTERLSAAHAEAAPVIVGGLFP